MCVYIYITKYISSGGIVGNCRRFVSCLWKRQRERERERDRERERGTDAYDPCWKAKQLREFDRMWKRHWTFSSCDFLSIGEHLAVGARDYHLHFFTPCWSPLASGVPSFGKDEKLLTTARHCSKPPLAAIDSEAQQPVIPHKCELNVADVVTCCQLARSWSTTWMI